MCSKKPAVYCAGDIYLRALNSDDWKILRAMRLRAVQMHPDYFGSTVEETKAQSQQNWIDFLNHPQRQIFGLFDQQTLVGITGVSPCKDSPDDVTGELHYSFIEPDYRNHGFSDLFYQARIAWALEHTNWVRITVGHRQGNEASRHAIIRNGFSRTHDKCENWPDGTKDTCLIYELILKRD